MRQVRRRRGGGNETCNRTNSYLTFQRHSDQRCNTMRHKDDIGQVKGL